MRVDPKFTRPGKGPNAKPMVLYSGLLDTATENGLRSITTKLVHLDLERKVAVVQATVSMETDGVTKLFEGIGDASPENAGTVAAAHWIRMAETRAKARALKDAINVGDCAIEGDEWDDAPDYVPARAPVPPPRPPAPAPSSTPADPATEAAIPAAFRGPAPAPEPTPIRPPTPEEAELADLNRRYAETVFDAEAHGLRAPSSVPTTAAGLTRAIESLTGQIARQRSIDQPPRRAGGGRR